MSSNTERINHPIYNKNKKCYFQPKNYTIQKMLLCQYIYHFNIMKNEFLSVNIYLNQLESKAVIFNSLEN